MDRALIQPHSMLGNSARDIEEAVAIELAIPSSTRFSSVVVVREDVNVNRVPEMRRAEGDLPPEFRNGSKEKRPATFNDAR